jgi:hypothetical protein
MLKSIELLHTWSAGLTARRASATSSTMRGIADLALARATNKLTQKANWARMAKATNVGQAPTESVAKANTCWPTRLASSRAVVASSQR